MKYKTQILLKQLTEKYPVAVFVILTFLITYSAGIILNGWISTSLALPQPLNIYVSRSLIVCAPGISVAIILWLQKKNIPLNIFRGGKRFFIGYFAIPIITLSISTLTLVIAGLDIEIIRNQLVDDWYLLLIHLFFQIFLVGLGEEIGWRGWLLPKLNEKFGLLKATFILLIIWILWHFPILFSDAAILIPWLMIITGLTFTLSWTWIKFGNTVFLFAIIHGSVNFPQFFWDNLSAVEPQLHLKNWEISGYVYLSIGLIALVLLLRSAKQSDERLSHP